VNTDSEWSSGQTNLAVFWVYTNVSEGHTASIFRSEDDGNMFLQTGAYVHPSPHGVTNHNTKIDTLKPQFREE
jgi:hypothetical protein